MAEYITGEKHQAMTSSNHTQSSISKPLLIGIGVVILLGLSFYSGVAYQKSRHPKSGMAAASSLNGGGGGFAGRGHGGQRPTIGQATAVSASSITVQNSSSGINTTLSITSSTQITDNGQTVPASDITVGNTVLVVASTTDKTQAARILVNPSFGGGANSSGTNTGTSANGSGSAVTN